MTQLSQPACPAAEITRGTLSLNEEDARCRITGLLRGTEGAPCVKFAPGGYCACPIWTTEKERIWISRKPARAQSMINAGSGDWV